MSVNFSKPNQIHSTPNILMPEIKCKFKILILYKTYYFHEIQNYKFDYINGKILILF